MQVQARNTGLHVEATKRYGWLEPYARFERFKYHDEINASGGYLKNAPKIGLWGYHKKVIWYMQAEYDQYNPVVAGQGFQGPYFKVEASYYYSPDLFVTAEETYCIETKHSLGSQGSINWKLPYNFQLLAFASYEKSNSGPGNFINNFSTTQVSIKLIKTFSWGKKTGVAGLKPGQEWLGSGSIEGWVFNDANLKGNKDADKAGGDRHQGQTGGRQRGDHGPEGVL